MDAEPSLMAFETWRCHSSASRAFVVEELNHNRATVAGRLAAGVR